MHRVAKFLAVSGMFLLCALALEGVSQGQAANASNTWVSAGQMTQARTGAAAVLLKNGEILITGGADANGVPQASAEFYNPSTGAFSAAPAMNVPRANHAAIVLSTGDVLVTGGVTDSGGDLTNTAEVFSASTQQWTQLQAMLGTGLAGHAMANLSDGNVLIAGGQSTTGPVGSLLLFNLSNDSITPIGSLLTARTNAAAAATPDGRILIGGGTDVNNNVLSSTEIFIYTPSTMTGAVSVGPSLTTARTAATATSTYDGVAIIGGYNVTMTNGQSVQTDLGTAEIFSQWTNAFRVVNGGTPRSGHFAVMLPQNGAILAMGGTGGQAVDLLQPWANGTAGAFIAGTASLSNHNGGFATPASLGFLLVAGGQGTAANAAELYWFPTIATDQPDYAPGTPVVMTGTGFQPGETVDLHLHLWVNQTTTDLPDYTATADGNGNFNFSGYAPNTTDIGARYHLTAVGESSGFQAQTVFTDNKNLTIAIVGTGSVTVAGTPTTPPKSPCSNTNTPCSESGLDNSEVLTLTASAPASWTLDSSWTANSGCGTGSTSCQFAINNSAGTLTVTFGTVASKLAFTTEPAAGALTAGACNTFTVTSENSSGTATDPTSALTVTLTSGHSPTGAFYTTNACTTSTTTATILTTASAVTVYYKDTGATSTAYTNTASSTGLTTATSNSYTVIAGAPAATTSTITGTSPVTANGTSTSTITITLEDANSNPVSGVTPTFSATGSNNTYGACSATNTSGVSTCTLASTKAETKTLSITSPVSVTGGTVTFQAGSASATTSTITGTSPVTADGVSTSTITITLEDTNSNPVSGVTPTFSANGSNNTYGTCSSSNTSGISTCTLASTKAQTETLSITAPVSKSGGSVTFTAGSPVAANSTITGTSPVTANGTSTSTITITLKDTYSNPVPGVTPTFSATGSNNTYGTCSSTNTSGVSTCTLASTTAQVKTLSIATPVTESGGSVTFQAGTPVAANSTITGTSPVTADGVSTSTITITLEDTNSNPVSGVTPTFSATGSNNTYGACSATNASGVSTCTLASTKAQVKTLSILTPVSVTGGSVTFQAGAAVAANSSISGTTPVTADGTSTSTITITLEDANSNPVSGVTPTFSATGSNNTYGACSATSASGISTCTLASTTAQVKTLSITSPVSVTGGTVTFQAGPLASITISPASATITAGGSQTYTATGYDQYGNSKGDVTSSTTFTVTNGICTANVCGSTLAGTQTVTGNDSGFMNTAALTVTPGAITHLALSPTPATITAGGSQAYTAAGYDMYGNLAGDVTGTTTFTIAPDGSCTGASCTATVAGAHTVTGTYTNGAYGTASLTFTAGSFTQLQILVPGETAAPGTTSGYTGSPNIEYVNGAFNATVNAVDQFWNVVSTVTDTVAITSSDTHAILPSNAALVAGTGTFSVTLETQENTPTTTVTATDATPDTTITPATTPPIEVIIVYTASIAPADWATGVQGSYTLTVNNAPAPNTDNLESVEIAVPAADQNMVANVAVSATKGNATDANWTLDSVTPLAMRFVANSGGDAVTPGGTITITFNATSSAAASSSLATEVWTTTAFSDIASTPANMLPLAPPEPTVVLGTAPGISSANSTSAFTYGAAGVTFTVTTSGYPTPSLSAGTGFPSWATFKDNGDGTATISGTPSAAGDSNFMITAHNGYGNDATQSFTLHVQQAPLTAAIVGDPTRPYNGNTNATLTAANFSLTGLVGTDSFTVTQTSGTYNSANVDSANVVTASLSAGNFTAGLGTLASNYNLPTTASGAGAITAVTLTAAIVNNPTRPYNGNATATLTPSNFSLTGLVSGESFTVTQTSGTYNSANVVSANVVTASLSASNFTPGTGTLAGISHERNAARDDDR